MITNDIKPLVQSVHSSIGKLVDIDTHQTPHALMVEINDQLLKAKSCVQLKQTQLGADVLVLVTDKQQLVIVGVIESTPVVHINDESHIEQNRIKLNGKILELKADQKLSLQCGKAQLILEQDGKVTVRGRKILSRAKRTNRIQGSSVELN
ncbi:hypothetical protein [Pragia fontium]|uniref:hypothetical protein n=1 Tax=Pragia fontium TaxID=82985 RepID=UPI000F6C7333|nr:hypothetical protein [Pragia fontium]VEJ56335.1 Uncharacterised protein [Pragia fontium]